MHSASRLRGLALGFVVAFVVLVVLHDSRGAASEKPVEPVQVMTVSLVLDRTSYLSGDPAAARAIVYRTPTPANYSFVWTVRNATLRTLTTVAGNDSTFVYWIPLNYTGRIYFDVAVDDGRGLMGGAEVSADVRIAVMSLRLDRGDFVPGDAITASYSVLSHVIRRPTYEYRVDDSSSTIVASGTTNATSFTFRTPAPASPTYAFLVTAREGLNVTEARATIPQAGGVLLGISFDRTAYAPGETIRAHLSVTPRGMEALPRQFEWTLTLATWLGPGLSARAITTEPEVDLALTIPDRIGTGDLLLFATEARTGASEFATVRIGPTNPLWTTEIAGIPLFAILLGLLSVAIFVAVIGLWRRMAAVPSVQDEPSLLPEPVIPSAPPPAEPRARSPPAAPMSVPCHHCGKPIELTTSRRPIEVMCPSCGETQLVS
jgi:hypothetical protein